MDSKVASIIEQAEALSVDELHTLNEVIVAMIRTKRELESQRLIRSFEKGDLVRLKNIRPKYLEGHTGRVVDVDVRKHKLHVEMVTGEGRFLPGSVVIVSAVTVDKV